MVDNILQTKSSSESFKISAKGATKVYSGKTDVKALESVDLEVSDNEFVCLVGPSGCGKSTLLRMFDGLHLPTAGAVEVKRDNPQNPTTAMVFQDYSIFPWMTVAENVGFGLIPLNLPKHESESRVNFWIDRIGLRDFADVRPSQLSGGMKQRVSIARAMAVQPEVLLMDEPFAALDAQLRRILQDELLAIWQEHRRTVVFITHSLEEAILLGDRVVVMSNRPGRIIADYKVPFERPRDPEIRLAPEFAELEQEIWHQLRTEVEQNRSNSGGNS